VIGRRNRLASLVTALVGLVAGGVAWAVVGTDGLWSALLGTVLVVVFLSAGSIAPAALWALALLLAILNAGMFVESASSRIPAVSYAGSLVSWFVLAAWWFRTAGAVGVLPSLAVVTGLTLITLAGHAWTHRSLQPGSATAVRT